MPRKNVKTGATATTKTKLPSYLFQTYQGYKQDGDLIATWLTKTARKVASYTSRKDQLRLIDFPTLAIQIANSDKKTIVPQMVVQRLRLIVDRRQKCYLWFGNQIDDDPKFKAQNSRHAFAIEIFERVLTILLGCEQETSTSKDPAALPAPAAGSSVAPPSESSHLAQYQLVEDRSIAMIEDKQDENLFKFLCYFYDISKVRGYVAEQWLDYRRELIDLETVSLLTESAIDILQKIETDFLNQSFPTIPNRGNRTPYTIMTDLILKSLFNMESDSKETSKDLVIRHATPLEKLLCVSTSQILDRRLKKLASAKEADRFIVYCAGPSASLSETDRDEQEVSKLLSYLMLLQLSPESMPAVDALSKGLISAINSKECTPMWLIFATQVYLDIIAVLGVKRSNPFMKLHSSTETLIKSADIHLEYCLPEDEQKNSPIRKLSKQMTTLVQRDVLENILKFQFSKDNNSTDRDDIPDWALYRTHPTLCGVLAFYFRHALRDEILAFENKTNMMQVSAMFYEAAVQTNAIRREWTDMNEFIRLQTPKELFCGGVPTTLDAWSNRFCIMKGTSVQNNAANPRKLRKGAPARNIPARQVLNLTPQSQIYRIYADGYDASKARPGMTIALLESLISKGTDSKASIRARRHIRASSALGPLEILSILKTNLISDNDHLKFNYLIMQVMCSKLLVECHHTTMLTVLAQVFSKVQNDDFESTKALKRMLDAPDIIGWAFFYMSKDIRTSIAARVGQSQAEEMVTAPLKMGAMMLQPHPKLIIDGLAKMDAKELQNRFGGAWPRRWCFGICGDREGQILLARSTGAHVGVQVAWTTGSGARQS